MKVPCNGCTKRELGCHSWCPDYKEYHEENIKNSEKKMISRVVSDHSPSQSSRIKKNTMHRMRRGLK